MRREGRLDEVRGLRAGRLGRLGGLLAAIAAAGGGGGGCFFLGGRGCGQGPVVEVTVFVAPVPAPSPFVGADRLVVEARGRVPGGVEEVRAVADFRAEAGPVSLRVPFGRDLRVHVEVLDAAGNVLGYGGSALHDLDEETWDGEVLRVGAFVTPVARTVQVATEGFPSLMSEARVGHSTTLLPDGRVLLTGGGLAEGLTGGVDPSTLARTATIWDPETGLFWSVSNGTGAFEVLAEGRAWHTATVLPGGAVLIAGGFGSGPGGPAPLFGAERIDYAGCILPERGAVVQRAICGVFPELNALSEARAAHTATLRADGTVVLAGGVGRLEPLELLASTEVYLEGLGFAPGGGAPMSVARAWHAATPLPDGTLLVTGGLGAAAPGECEVVGSAEVYGLDGSWTAIGGMATPRAMHGASVGLAETGAPWVIVSGGFTELGPGRSFTSPTPLVESFEPGVGFVNALARVVPGLTGIAGHASVALDDGRVVLLGGMGTGGVASAAVTVVEPRTGGPLLSVDAGGGLLVPRAHHGAVALPSGQLFIAGGLNAGGGAPVELVTAEVFTPAIPR